MDYSKLLPVIKDHVTKWFHTHDAPQLYYHNLSHTTDVIDAVNEIAAYYHLNERDLFIVQTAAWFHDIAFQEGAEGHESKGAQRAEAFLRIQGVDDPTIQSIKGCILATKLPQNPTGLLQQIVCDADLFHLGKADFIIKNKLLRKEEQARTGHKTDKEQWRINTLHFLQNHQFFTEYCQQHLNKRKQKLIKELKQKLDDPEKHNGLMKKEDPKNFNEVNIIKDKGKDAKKNTEKGIEIMFRISATNNVRLSNMADNKAHIMITVNSIIISVLLSVLVRNISEYSFLALPVSMLLLVNLLTIFFSILATRPNLPEGRFTQNDIDEKRANLLFFGNYYRMSFEDYSEGMTKIMEDQDFLYTSLKRDLYQQGIVLSKKYRLLRISYSIFMWGLIAAVIAFIIAAYSH